MTGKDQVADVFHVDQYVKGGAMPICVDCIPPKTGCYVYLFCFFGRENEPIGPVKIGITSNVAARLASVQTGQHKRVTALAVFGTPNRDIAREREGAFHTQFASHRLEGEWFGIDPVDALESLCGIWRYYFQRMPEAIDHIGVPHYEREVRAYRAWRAYYAENSNVARMAGR